MLLVVNVSNAEVLNLDFEQGNNKWVMSSNVNYRGAIDSNEFQQGKNSYSIKYTGESASDAYMSYTIPAIYIGKKLTLTGYVKTDNVIDGYAGLWLLVKPTGVVASMENLRLSGTNDWKKYEITIDLNSETAKEIQLGGDLYGKGTVWFDNFTLFIDGKPLSQAPLKVLLGAEKDHQFDQGSNISINSLSEQDLDKLELLGKVWGFLKYHHPAIAKGEFNWDYELFRILPKILQAKTDNGVNYILLSWIDSLGAVGLCQPCKVSAQQSPIKPNLDWTSQLELSPALKSKIQFIYDNRSQEKHYYISQEKVGHPNFSSESKYTHMPYPDSGFRLLALYRLWNIVEYYFPYKHLTDNEWDSVLRVHIVGFVSAKNTVEYEQAAELLITEINDTHAKLTWTNALFNYRGNRIANEHIRYVEGKFIVDGYHVERLSTEKSLRRGDIITHINNKPISEIVKKSAIHTPASNFASKMRDVSRWLLRSSNNTIDVKYVRENKPAAAEVALHSLKAINYLGFSLLPEGRNSYEILDGNIGYVYVGRLLGSEIAAMRKALINTSGIIIDLRTYPAGFNFDDFSSFFVTQETEYAAHTLFNINNPGEFIYGPNSSVVNTGETYGGKLVVIVNQITQSAAETLAMILGAGLNTTIIGSTTSGANGNVSRIILPGGISTTISAIGMLYPDHSVTQRVGIVPDIEVLPTIKGIAAGRDEELDKAISIINDL